MDEYKHYYRFDDADRVVFAFSDAFAGDNPLCIPKEGDYLVETGGRQFSPNLQNLRDQYIYKHVEGEIVERSQQELDDEWAVRPPVPETAEQKIARLEAELAEKDRENKNALFEIYSMILGGE